MDSQASLKALRAWLDDFEHAYVADAVAGLGQREFAAIITDRDVREQGDIAELTGWWQDPYPPSTLTILPNPWDHREAIPRYAAYARHLARDLITGLASALNALHGRSYPYEYWELLLGRWIRTVVSAVLDRRLFCIAARAVAPTAPFIASAEAVVPSSIDDAVSQQRTDGWNNSVVCTIARDLGAAIESHLFTTPEISAAADLPPGSLRRSVKSVLYRPATRIRGRRLVLMGALRLSSLQLFMLGICVRGLRLVPVGDRPVDRPWCTHSPAVDHEARATVVGAKTESADERLAILRKLLPDLLPRSVVEAYESLAEVSWRSYGPPTNVVHGNWGWNEVENEFLGRCAADGRKITFAQHGGSYLQLKTNLVEAVEVEWPGSPFMAWGRASGPIVTAPSPYLHRLRNRHRRNGRGLLVIEPILPPESYVLRLSSIPLANQTLRELRLLTDFLSALQLPRDMIRLKTFPGREREAARPTAMASLRRIPSNRGDAATWLRRSRMAVVPYPDTPFIEALVLGTPAIGLWDSGLWEMREDARPYFDRLARVSVIHSDSRKAAEFVSSVYANPHGWWDSQAVQEARHAFLDRFAAQDGWRRPWCSRLRAEARA